MTTFDERGQRIQHKMWHGEGEERLLTLIKSYKDDKRHGLSRTWWKGELRSEGHWDEGVPTGRWRWWDDGGELKHELVFDEGQVAEWNGKEIEKLLPAIPAESEVVQKLFGTAALEFIDMPLQDVVAYLSEVHGFPMCIQTRAFAEAGLSPEMRKTVNIRNFPLIAALAIMLHEDDLCCVYRHEMLWITTREDQRRGDRTGMEQLRAAENSALAEQLEQPARIESATDPLEKILAGLAARHGVRFRCESVDTTVVPALAFRGVSLRSALGILLQKLGLRAELGEDGMLCLLPRENDPQGVTPGRGADFSVRNSP